MPCRAVPLRDAVDGLAAGGGECAADDQRIVPDRQRVDFGRESADAGLAAGGEICPRRAVERRDIVDQLSARNAKEAADDETAGPDGQRLDAAADARLSACDDRL